MNLLNVMFWYKQIEIMNTQIIKLAVILFLGVSVSAYAQDMNKGQGQSIRKEKKMIGHVNPLPNYMKVIVNKGDKLDLTETQKENFSSWQTVNNPKVMKLTKEIMYLEKEVNNLSLKKESKETLLSKIDEIADLRRKIAIIKTKCRDNLIKTLSENQWEKLLVLYKTSEG